MSGSPDMDGGDNAKAVAVGQLKAFIERVERLEEDKKAVAEDIKQVYLEAKATGFNVKIMRQMVRERKMDTAERQEFYAVEELYREALALETEQALREEGLD
jgi:uncharacterized protein (UPF0335 family)